MRINYYLKLLRSQYEILTILQLKYNQLVMRESHQIIHKLQEISSEIYRRPKPNLNQERFPLGNSRVYAKTGQWTDQQKRLYLDFLKRNSQYFEKKQPEPLKIAFRQMSRCVKTRKANQCRLYHQKMQSYYESVPNIIHYLSQYVDSLQKKEECPSDLYLHKAREVQSQPSLIKKQKEQPNNSKYHHEQQFPIKRAKKRKLSLKIPDQQHEDISKDEELPKTDLSIGPAPLLPSHQLNYNSLRNSIPYNFAQLQPFKIEDTSQFIHNAFYPRILHRYHPMSFLNSLRQASFYPNYFFEEIRKPANSRSCQDWWQCHSMFLAWQQKSRKLLEDIDNEK